MRTTRSVTISLPVDLLREAQRAAAEDARSRRELIRDALEAVEGAFGSEIDYAMLVKLYEGESGQRQAEARYSPAQCLGTREICIGGRPDLAHISTSVAERQNLTMRMGMRRFTR